MSEESKRKISNTLTGIVRSIETRKKISASKRGVPFTATHRMNLSIAHKGLPGNPHTPESKEKIRKSHLGERCIWWKGGVSLENKRIRSSGAYRNWRNLVFQRDNYTCQECGERGGVLDPHHVKSFAYFPELRLEPSNGITLCHSCHKKTYNYGNRKIHTTRATTGV